MSYPTGQVLSAPIVNGSPQDAFGTHIDYLGVGGYRTVASIAARDAIPTKTALEYDGLGSGMRRHLMLVAVEETGLIYILYKSDYSILTDDVARIAALRDNANWISLTSFLKVIGTGTSSTIGELPEYVATQDGAQLFPLPANATGVLDINVLSTGGDCRAIYQKYYNINNGNLLVDAAAGMQLGDKLCGSYYVYAGSSSVIPISNSLIIIDIEGDDRLLLSSVQAS